MRFWDPLVRLSHWALVAALTLAWFSGEEALRRHEIAGYAALTLVAIRAVWGFCGGRYARFSQFVRSPVQVWRYARDMACGAEVRHVGHNPLGGWMIVVLMLGVAAVGLSGWLYTLDAYWGIAWLEWLHRALAWALVALAGLHVAGVAWASWRHRENLVAAMLSGRKAPPRGNDVA